MSDADTVPVWARRRFERLVGRGLPAALARRIVLPTKRLPVDEIPEAPSNLIRFPVLAYSSDAV
ncbi:hypothetical protein [Methylobacterium dankookense]|uniref:Uncharacterized protein n=1 Tax=Methylobacterium dankookense TaxID=560405 RepID=A0A564FTH4_9HYPH|nr:hypothetical protein [Methylobacterium dankookense]GJD54890.1 hypothetical protein IFDJLNFL_0769 [Methylobacterium dankookense]VUF11108.1 hypothetical protein MTDSW087_00781 [Methylobacterium dankookense]